MTRRAFTLMELLIVITVIAILAGLVVSGLIGAYEQARASRTRAIVSKLDTLIMERWEGYRTRPVSARATAGMMAVDEQYTDSNANRRYDSGEPFIDKDGDGVYDYGAARLRLYALRELMRVELPERISDLCTPAELADLAADNDLDVIDTANVRMISGQPVPAVAKSMKRLAARPGGAWTNDHQGAECLYLIVSMCKDGDKSAIDYFTPDEIGDIDGDLRKEILDGWGRPIEFLRWCPGYTHQQQAMTLQSEDIRAHDPFDPLKVDGDHAFELRPLIYSAGPDGAYDVAILTAGPTAGSAFAYWMLTPANDPYYLASPALSGTPFDSNANGEEEWADNITNHWVPEQ